MPAPLFNKLRGHALSTALVPNTSSDGHAAIRTVSARSNPVESQITQVEFKVQSSYILHHTLSEKPRVS